MTDNPTWSDERVELLKKLWSDGLSASQIAAELGGVTRNAVIGKVHRLGLSGRAKAPATGVVRTARKATARAPSHPMTHKAPPARPQAALPPAPVADIAPVLPVQPTPVEEVAVPVSERVTIMDLREYMCRWPMGDPTSADFRFCGARCATGLPYCPTHSRIAYQPAADRRRDRKVVLR